jgi:DNA-directed RNA polymerase specialized sigma24 family protein
MAFPETRWSVLAAATLHGDERARQALEETCRCYWQPVFAVIRSRVREEDDARDQTQGFFTYLLEKSALRRADRARGRFRTFLLTLLWRYLRDERVRATAGKRGGPDAAAGSDDELETLPAEVLPLAETLDREWALATLDRAITVVRAEVISARGEAAWAVLRGFLPGSASVPPMATAAAELGLSEAGVRTEVHRLRLRCREALRRDLMRTVTTPEDLDSEIEYLGRTLRVAAAAPVSGKLS